ncbi:hypothetical protein H2198_003569 [Neophaeococcomyces mojaviensis]|uniref:Uncharacterized protein n=1 Tax=Neophaeococcomyces mojaviensis TaxID=3383035 RepID=A0ACC3ABJ5_9EURO|nr:hypothetical protein H2198_003569 [Knufia sp. JES_112]
MSDNDNTIDYTSNFVDATNLLGYIGNVIVNPGAIPIPAGGTSIPFTVQSSSIICYKTGGQTDLYNVDTDCKFDVGEKVTMTGSFATDVKEQLLTKGIIGPDDNDAITVAGASVTGKYKLSSQKL